MAATIVTHMMISLNNHIGRAPNTNANYKKVVTIQEFEKITEVKYKSVIEQQQLPPAGSVLFQYDLNEPAKSVGESLARVAKKVRTFSESKTISEALGKKVTHLLAETKTITEGLAKQKKAVRTFLETAIVVGDSLSKSIKRVKALPESVSVSEGLVASRKFPRTISEPAKTISDGLAPIAKKVRTFSESTNIQESLAHLKTGTLNEEPVTVIDSLAVSRKYPKTLSDTTTISDSLRLKAVRAVTEITAITEGIGRAKQFPRHFTENVFQGIPYAGVVSYTYDSFTFSLTHIIQDQLARLVHRPLPDTVTITESLVLIRRAIKAIIENTPVTELLIPTRVFQRWINANTFTTTSFTTDPLESFNAPSGDVVIITEELEGFVLPPGIKAVIEDPIPITESLVSQRTVFRTIAESPIVIGESLTGIIPIPVPAGGGGGANRRRIRRARYNAYLRTLQLQPIKTPIPEEPEHEPLTFEEAVFETPIAITESLTALTIRKEKVIVSVAAATPPPQIIEKEVEKIVYVDREKEKLVEIQPPPIIKAQDILISKPKPIEIEQEILVSTQSHSNKMKSRAASAQLRILEELMTLAEMEGMV